MLKLWPIFFMAAGFFLTACHHDSALSPIEGLSTNKQTEAAFYNVQLGLAYLQQGNRSLAKHKLLQALQEAPTSPSTHAAMAYFMEKSGEAKQAQWHYRKAIALAPHDGAALNNYGVFLCKKGLYKVAEAYFLNAVEDMSYAHTANAYENAGLCAMSIPDTKKAKKYFLHALKVDPTQKQSLYELVNLELKQHHYNQALQTLQHYPKLTIGDPTLVRLAYKVAHKTGKKKLATYYHSYLPIDSDQTGGNDEYNNNR